MKEKIIKNAQENALASWIDLINQIRINEILEKLENQKLNFQESLKLIEELKESIAKEVIETNRGGEKGIHGFIAERLQVYIENAKSAVEGEAQEYVLIDDNGAVDYLRGKVNIQQKAHKLFCSIEAIKEHYFKYINFVEKDGIYQIPRDYYAKVEKLWDLSEEEIAVLKVSNHDDYLLHKYITFFRSKTNITIEQIEPMEFGYDEIQKNTYEKAIEERKEALKERNKEKEKEILKDQNGTLKEGAQAALVGAGLEGGIAFCLATRKKLKEGKRLSDFTEDDWKDVGIETSGEAIKGGLRGGTIYALTNFTAMPANVASAYFTAAYGVAAQYNNYKKGLISKEDFVINCETLSLDVSISATSAMLGQAIIPIPVLGAIIGSVTGDVLYKLWKECDEKETKEIIDSYNKENELLEKQLEAKYYEFLLNLKKAFKKYKSIEELAFDKDINSAFENSIRLAIECNVDPNKVIKNKKERDVYFQL